MTKEEQDKEAFLALRFTSLWNAVANLQAAVAAYGITFHKLSKVDGLPKEAVEIMERCPAEEKKARLKIHV